jgi:hypothetical protein
MSMLSSGVISGFVFLKRILWPSTKQFWSVDHRGETKIFSGPYRNVTRGVQLLELTHHWYHWLNCEGNVI